LMVISSVQVIWEHPICAMSINTQAVSVLEYDKFKALLSHNKGILYHSVL
jgi:hypothetical protein